MLRLQWMPAVVYPRGGGHDKHLMVCLFKLTTYISRNTAKAVTNNIL